MIAVLLTAVIGAAAPARLTPAQAAQQRSLGLLFQRAHADWKAGRRPEALAGMGRARVIAEALHGRDSWPSLATLDWLAGWSGHAGRWDDAAGYRERVWRVKAALLGAAAPDAIDARWTWELVKAAAALTPEGRAGLGRAETLARSSVPLDAADALPKYEAALKGCEAALGKGHPVRAMLLNALGQLRHDLGHHARALALYREALAVRREALGEAHPLYAQSLNNLAILHSDLGDHRAALPLMRQAYAIKHAALGERAPETVTLLGNLASLLGRLGENAEAVRLFRRAVPLSREVDGQGSLDYAHVLNNLAGALADTGDKKESLALHEQATEVARKAVGEKHPLWPVFLHNLAVAHEVRGDTARARALLGKVLAALTGTHGERHPWYARAAASLATVCVEAGDADEARRLSEHALGVIASALNADAAAQSDRQQVDAARWMRYALNVRLSLPDAGGYAHLLTWKGAGLMRQRQRRVAALLASDPETREAAGRLQEATRALAALARKPSAPREEFERLTDRQERAQAELSRLSAEAKKAGERPTPEALAKALPEGAVLVDYLFHRYFGKKADHLTAFIVRAGSAPARVDLGPSAAVEKAASAWRAALLRGGGGEAGAALKKLIWAPLEKHLKDAKVVLVSPDGVLGTVPFAALPGAKAGAYLIEDVALALAPVPQALPGMLAPHRPAAPALLAVGGLDYAMGWEGLPGAAAEADEIKRLFKGEAVTDLRRGDATPAAVRAALGRVSFAHLATHGYFAPESMKAGLGPAGGLFGREGVGGWHPLLLSGLVLSADDGGGVLTALEVSEMDLSRLDLAVLSACETGLGKVAGGEGILGLQRAFAAAGARSVVASLWKVPDEATRVLMGRFYANLWGRKMGRLESLAEAQRWMLKEGHTVPGVARGTVGELMPEKGTRRLPPYHWAAFVLSGDWR